MVKVKVRVKMRVRMRVKEESEKLAYNSTFKKKAIMASSPITSWQIYGETMEAVTDFIFLGCKASAVGD